jgi:hypothetical protein
MNSEGMRHSPEPFFYYSSTPAQIAYFLLLAVFIPVLLIEVWTRSVVGSLFFFILDSLLVGSFVRLYTYPVHHARFFDDYFDVRGRKLNKRIGYDQVSKVEKFVVIPILTNRTQVRILVNKELLLVIPGNLRSKTLKTDLYSWLSSRVSKPSTEGSA